ncbi:hypothetical protein Hypma_013244 [Hypsizygus marmoreus]|uniref:Uncharacterized protein n=1 Tax=Hypsizygus marmoreus TaxID=39966 RepID=A0A369JBX0_HYPMA|nr:hypothetical protein Hypma_013244 [Hypsizygus marmoreus]
MHMAFSEGHKFNHPASDDGSSVELHRRQGVFLITLIFFSDLSSDNPTQLCPSHLTSRNLVFLVSISVSSHRSHYGEHAIHILPFAGMPPTFI